LGRSIAVLPGDGIGPEVTHAAVQALEATGLDLEPVVHDVGVAAFRRTGRSVPADVLAACKDADSVLFGATKTPPGLAGYQSAIVMLRRELDLHANLRPARSLPGLGAPGLDLLVVRENTEGLYSGLEERSGDRATATRVITRAASERIARVAFREAQACGARRVLAVHKANILPQTDGLFLEACRAVAAQHPGIALQEGLVDSVAAGLVLQPAQHRVLVTTNLFGDILSDLAAGLMGGLGLAPSANLGDRHALFEPVHGSAPDIAGKGIANPAGALRSAALLLRHLGAAKHAERLELAVDAALADPRARTPDLGGAASTATFTNTVLRRLSP
jgi:isopropylmalate/isohomocitrate dehydrogenase-like protein